MIRNKYIFTKNLITFLIMITLVGFQFLHINCKLVGTKKNVTGIFLNLKTLCKPFFFLINFINNQDIIKSIKCPQLHMKYTREKTYLEGEKKNKEITITKLQRRKKVQLSKETEY
jgi:hypothetical protein